MMKMSKSKCLIKAIYDEDPKGFPMESICICEKGKKRKIVVFGAKSKKKFYMYEDNDMKISAEDMEKAKKMNLFTLPIQIQEIFIKFLFPKDNPNFFSGVKGKKIIKLIDKPKVNDLNKFMVFLRQ